ncbi:hypothetical protein LTR17_006442 [Elasticomyces elasticus]|nr:hypothetical protein LTR17_006442 [Elasticomyces elasticus]
MADTLIVGIDFGTTFSGVAAAYSASPESPDEINIVKTWPGGNNITSDKVPSEVAYGVRQSTSSAMRARASGASDVFNLDPLNQTLDHALQSSGDTMRWGFQIRPDEDRLRCLKLFLDPSQPIPDHISLPDVRQQLMLCGKNVNIVVAEFLRALFAHTKEILSRRYGQQFVATTKLKIVLTVPAVWSDTAKDATLKAAEAAGMGNDIAMISEPEAAAVYTLQAIQPNNLKVGNNFIVIDAGGGTVDLISYRIEQLKPLRLEETAKGSGGFCGAAFLNVRFEKFVRDKLGITAFDTIRTTKPKSWLMALKYFEEYVKRNYNPSDDLEFNIPFPGVPDNPNAGIEGGFLVMDSTDVGMLFRPIIDDIISLVEGQIAQLRGAGLEVDGLVLVGGFGQSECLLQYLKSQFSNGPRGIEVLQPVNAWTAVVRGAVLRGLEGGELVTSRKARRHYGVRCRKLYDAALHPPSSKTWDELGECWKAEGQMWWYISKGQTVLSTQPVLFPFFRTFTPGASKTIIEELIICDKDTAPAGFNSATTRSVCKMVVNLGTVPQHLWDRRCNSQGNVYESLTYDVGMQIESGGLRFDFRVDGVIYGTATATFV